jgi:hypothetical protein
MSAPLLPNGLWNLIQPMFPPSPRRPKGRKTPVVRPCLPDWDFVRPLQTHREPLACLIIHTVCARPDRVSIVREMLYLRWANASPQAPGVKTYTADEIAQGATTGQWDAIGVCPALQFLRSPLAMNSQRSSSTRNRLTEFARRVLSSLSLFAACFCRLVCSPASALNPRRR